MGMFSNFSSTDFARVLLIEEMSEASLRGIIVDMRREGVGFDIVSEFINVQRKILGMSPRGHSSFEDILNDDLVVDRKKYYKKCEELKIVLILYLVEFREEGNMFKVYRSLEVLDKYVGRIRGDSYWFEGYKELIRNKM